MCGIMIQLIVIWMHTRQPVNNIPSLPILKLSGLTNG